MSLSLRRIWLGIPESKIEAWQENDRLTISQHTQGNTKTTTAAHPRNGTSPRPQGHASHTVATVVAAAMSSSRTSFFFFVVSNCSFLPCDTSGYNSETSEKRILSKRDGHTILKLRTTCHADYFQFSMLPANYHHLNCCVLFQKRENDAEGPVEAPAFPPPNTCL